MNEGISNNQNASLTVVGTGVKFKSHLTTEAKIHIQGSDMVFYLVNEPAIREWIINNSVRSESLNNLYSLYALRNDCYKAMTQQVMDALRQQQHVCFVLYGHPSVIAKPGLDAAIQARLEGFQSTILPGISAQDCLFSDLMINPGVSGCMSYEATDFLVYKRVLDNRSHVILWQVGFIGALGYPDRYDNSNGITVLTKTLLQYYKPSHQVTLYEAAQYPHMKPRITKVVLDELPSAECNAVTTLYIPPEAKSVANEEVISALNMQKEIKNANQLY